VVFTYLILRMSTLNLNNFVDDQPLEDNISIDNNHVPTYWFVQGDKINTWYPAEKWQVKLFTSKFILDNPLNSLGGTICKHGDYNYLYYHDYGDAQGYYNPKILNLDTGTTRLVRKFKLSKHNKPIKINDGINQLMNEIKKSKIDIPRY
jgi:hypothetical protein